MVNLDHEVKVDLMDPEVKQVPLDLLVMLVLLDLKERKDHKEPVEKLDLLDPEVNLESEVLLESLDLMDNLDHLDLLVSVHWLFNTILSLEDNCDNPYITHKIRLMICII